MFIKVYRIFQESANVNLEFKKTLSKLNDAQNMQKTQESFIHRLQKKLLLGTLNATFLQWKIVLHFINIDMPFI